LSKTSEKRNLLKIPPVVREQFFSPFYKPEPETVHPDLYRDVIDYSTDLILERLKKYNEDRKRVLKKVKEKLTIRQAYHDEELAKETLVVSSDAGNNGAEFRSAYAPLYSSVAIATRGWGIIDEPIKVSGKGELWSSEYRPKERESILAMKLQFDVTLDAARKWGPELIVFDGSLLLHWGLIPSADGFRTKGYWRDFRDAAVSAMKLLRFCYEGGIAITGFVKRTRSTIISSHIRGLPQELKYIRDTVLLDLVLRLGQYTYLEVEHPGGGVVNQYKIAGKEIGLSAEEVDSLTNLQSTFIRTGLATPYRLETPQYCLKELDKMATILFTTSEETGIPFGVNEADNLTKMTNTISNLRSLMLFSKALDLVDKGEMEPEDLNLLALQYGEPWTLREEGYFQDVERIQEKG